VTDLHTITEIDVNIAAITNALIKLLVKMTVVIAVVRRASITKQKKKRKMQRQNHFPLKAHCIA
jgi:hypothetical protein